MNNLFKGTKGKWYRSGTVVVSDKNSFEIADVWAANGLPHHEWTEDHKQEAEANARLIAAAPGLLEYAKKVVDLISEEGIYLELDAWSRNDILNLEHYVNKALGNE